jgi:hypothetical protein
VCVGLGFVWQGLLDSCNCDSEAFRGVEDLICGSDGGDRNGVVAESESVGDAFATGVGH